ncbi:hypothetical protein VTO42DRAFT_1460 [Malbranchea cinnamomea]
MPRSRSRSLSPPQDERRRSRSPRRREGRDRDRDRPGRRHGGFRWKEKRRDEDATRSDRERGLERGYRETYRPRDRYDRDRDDTRRSDGDRRRDDLDRRDRKSKEKNEKKPAATAPSEPMIIVHVNDRLGTKAAIPCLASDPIRLFKAQVAARIGREPHEILLKRQGERPFKDQLTLEDYGISNGVQLDLEVDTGD